MDVDDLPGIVGTLENQGFCALDVDWFVTVRAC